MTTDQNGLVQKLWSFCDVLRHDGLSYGDYIEQLTYLLFLKMADEQHQLLGEEQVVPDGLDWPSLLIRSGPELEAHYSSILTELGRREHMLGVIFRKARNRVQNPAKLEQLIKDFIDNHEWLSLNADLKGAAYEGLIERTAREGARGAGQYFTPRAVISAIVDVMQPKPGDRICDPACGTGGFFLGAYESIVKRFSPLDPGQKAHLRSGAFTGWEIADLPARLCAMNLLLHGIESPESDSPVHVGDALQKQQGGEPFDMVLTNPPFGTAADDGCEREDFWAVTRNKQLNFVQHVVGLLKPGGSAAVVVPDNVLFEGGAGETIRRRLLHDCDVHTLLRLPKGIFYAQGINSNVLFFERKPGAAHPWTRELWVYDLRTNKRFTLKQNPLTRADLDDFVECYKPGDRHLRVESERFKRYSYDELIERDKAGLDLTWLRDDSLEDPANLPPPGILAAEIVDDLESALADFRSLAATLDSTARPGPEFDGGENAPMVSS